MHRVHGATHAEHVPEGAVWQQMAHTARSLEGLCEAPLERQRKVKGLHATALTGLTVVVESHSTLYNAECRSGYRSCHKGQGVVTDAP